jgi:hypothetical protein
VPPARPGIVDPLEPLRRIEQALPALGRELDAALALPTPQAAIALLDIAERELAHRVASFPTAAFAVARAAAGDTLPAEPSNGA